MLLSARGTRNLIAAAQTCLARRFIVGKHRLAIACASRILRPIPLNLPILPSAVTVKGAARYGATFWTAAASAASVFRLWPALWAWHLFRTAPSQPWLHVDAAAQAALHRV